ncbi:pyridoxamine 5'-phosphate oxidase like, partial [Haematococcus lacustris]
MATAGVDWDSSKGEFIYFLTPKDSEKVKEVLADPAVALVFSDDSNSQWASVTAHAEAQPAVTGSEASAVAANI